MKIRSQYGNIIDDYPYIYLSQVGDDYKFTDYMNNILATYSTRGKALKVLDRMIRGALDPSSARVLHYEKHSIIYLPIDGDRVYQFPTESEADVV